MEGSKENRSYKLHCLYGNPIACNFFSPKLNFAQFLNRNVKILGRRLYSSSFKYLAWLDGVQLIYVISHIFVCKFWLGRQMSRCGLWEKNLQTNVWKIKNVSSATSSKGTSFKLGEHNLLPSILMF